MSSSVDQIKSKLDIVTVVGGYVKLEKAGQSFKGKCPFHNEKTPSFFVSPDRGSYYCFGCQAKGDIFTFVQEFEGLDFKGALKVLADRAGVTLEAFSGQANVEDKSEKDAIFSLMEQARFYFEKNLSENVEAQEYLKERGVSDATIKNFRIGYALSEWRGLHDFLISKGATVATMERAGLIKKSSSQEGMTGSSQETRYYDTFRSRIIFPIADSSGRIVAFSGRIYPDNPNAPKYLNSPETSIFHKSEILFGLDKAKKDIHAKGYSILVEGQMDLIMLHQSGLTNTVASSGTALTEDHLKRLMRLSPRLIMAFDGDPAGFKAVVRGGEIALSLGMEVKVAEMPKGSDPADMAVKDTEGLLNSIRNSKHIISFILSLVLHSSTDSRVVARKIVSDVLPFVSRLQSSSEKAHFIKEIQTKTGIKEEALWEDLRKVNSHESLVNSGGVKKIEEKKIIEERGDLILKKLFGILFWQSEKNSPDIDVSDLENKISERVSPEQFLKLKFMYTEQKDSLLFEAESYYNMSHDLTSHVTDLLHNLAEEKLKKEFTETMALLHRAEVSHDTTESARLFEECQRISKELNTFKNRTIEK